MQEGERRGIGEGREDNRREGERRRRARGQRSYPRTTEREQRGGVEHRALQKKAAEEGCRRRHSTHRHTHPTKAVPTAAIPMENPCCSCRHTGDQPCLRRGSAFDYFLWRIPAAAAGGQKNTLSALRRIQSISWLVMASPSRRREFCHFASTTLFIPVESPDKGTGGCHQMTVSPTAGLAIVELDEKLVELQHKESGTR